MEKAISFDICVKSTYLVKKKSTSLFSSVPSGRCRGLKKMPSVDTKEDAVFLQYVTSKHGKLSDISFGTVRTPRRFGSVYETGLQTTHHTYASSILLSN